MDKIIALLSLAVSIASLIIVLRAVRSRRTTDAPTRLTEGSMREHFITGHHRVVRSKEVEEEERSSP